MNWQPGRTLKDCEKDVILTAYRFFQFNKTATANALGIAVRTLDKKLSEYEAENHKNEAN